MSIALTAAPTSTARALVPTFAQAKPALVVGLMSGTSLDGLDLCAVRLGVDGQGTWTYEIAAAKTIVYTHEWYTRLDGAFAASEKQLEDLDRSYGSWLGEQVRLFCESENLEAELIACHGHTIHHRPDEGYTLQIGDAAALSEACGVPVVADFRTADVALGGQGAPLVPVADRLLFGGYAQCLNLGGFANVSYEASGERLAYDITAVGVLLNRLAQRIGEDYDAGGARARRGTVDQGLLRQLTKLPFYQQPAPKSLGREWLEAELWPLVNSAKLSVDDALATCTVHIAEQLGRDLAKGPAGECLVTGGGGYNTFLIEGLRQNLPSTHSLVLPTGELIEYKEALAFALFGALRMRGEINTLASVTGASRDACTGVFTGLR